MIIEFRKLISQLVILLSGLFWLLYHSITMIIMITIVIKNLRYLPTSSIIICPAVISNRFPLNLVPVWFVILLEVVEVYILACSPDITSNWFYIWKLFPNLIEFLARSQNCEKRLLASSCLSVRPPVSPHETTRVPLDGFSRNLVFEYYSKSFRENSSFIIIGNEEGYFAWRPIDFSIISHSVLLRMKNISNKSCRETRNTHFMFNDVSPKIMPFMR